MRMHDGRELGRKICEALNLDPLSILSIRLDINTREVPVIVIERFVGADESEGIKSVLEEYEVVPRER